jgi:hypothetical protein
MSQRRRFLLKLLFLSLVLGSFESTSTQTENKVAQKFDEFGDVLYSDLIARLDNFAVELMKDATSKGFLIVYRTRRDLPGLNHARAMRMKDYLVQSRGLPRDRVVTVDGGVAEHLTQELWIVPPGTAPTPRSDARIGYVQNPESAWKFDEHGFLPLDQYKRFGISHNQEAEAEAEYLEAYANEVKKNPSHSACIIVYAQYNRHPQLVDWSGDYEPRRETRLDPPRTAQKELNRQRHYLMTVYGIPGTKVKTIDGGYRKSRWIEFWIVPADEPLPIPTPNAFPFGRKRRGTTFCSRSTDDELVKLFW